MARTCLIVSSPGKKGHERQAMAVANRLNATPDIVSADAVLKDADSAVVHDLVIAAGRQAIGKARSIARAGGPVVAVLQPVVWRPDDFDLIWAPAHDRMRPKKSSRVRLVETLTAPCVVTREEMAASAEALCAADGLGPPPYVGVLIGGQSRAHRFGRSEAQELAGRLASFANTHDVRLLVSTSRRTPRDTGEAIAASLGAGHLVLDSRAPEAVPPSLTYAGILGLSTAFIVTSDSFAMMSEAAFTGKPLYGWRLPGGKAKFERFYQGLEAHGALRWFDGGFETWRYRPLDATATVARVLEEMLDLAQARPERI